MVNGPKDLPRLDLGSVDWYAIDWRAVEREVQRLRQRIFKASQEGDLTKVRSLQKLTAPRGALSYPRLQPGGTRREVPGSDG
jgi:RNA-directed DNA polymerase